MPMPDVDINAGYIRQVQHLSNLREKSYNADMVRETELLKLKIANLKKYDSLREESAKKLAARDLVYTQTTFDARKKKLEDETKLAIKEINKKYANEQAKITRKEKSGAISDADAAAQKAALKQKQAAEVQEAKNRQKQNEKELTEKFKLGKKLQAQQDKENLAAAYKNIQAEAKERGLKGKEAQEFISQQAKDLGIDETKAKAAAKQTQKAEKLVDAFGKLADYAKQLDSKIDSIAEIQTAVDTRLQGSKNKTKVTITGAKSY